MDMMGDDLRKAIPALGFYPQVEISTGTTLIAMEYDGGVVIGTDSRTSAGSFISSRTTNKITPITDHLSVCRSGSAADTQAIADITKYYIETHSLLENEPVTIYRSSQIFRQFLYQYRDSLSASVIIAGWDAKLGGQLYAIPIGGFTTRQRSTASGSGSTYVLGYLDKAWKPNLTKEECIEIVKTAVGLAVFRDGSSGGVVRIGVINENGTDITLYRPDKPGFPTVTLPTAHLTYAPHVKNQ
ncbi:hypothetical protein PFISCL1PPCAC_14145 [Pristionchus fissidentatus]|uniref:Proteasome subunit beta n=1 Tax=Pristionchus fissidentatus TaxID=1538716 RepID=A0AAV5VTS6_9BILA|nr:hypothetical protein PFISCL1PPCAC_14145 [Pristionchus fissidentatus]